MAKLNKLGKGLAVIVALFFSIITVVLIGKKSQNMGSNQTRGRRNNNPLNIRRTNIDWVGERKIVTDPSFEEFETLTYGYRAAIINLRTHWKRGKQTINDLVSVWAPPSENNTSSYVEHVAKGVGLNPDGLMLWNEGTVYLLVKEMARIESNLKLTSDEFQKAWALTL